jgi:sporulation protein YlmC with PRC-barrel domain
MSAHTTPSLTRLGDHGLTIAHHDADVRGHRVRDKEDKDIGRVTELLIDLDDRKVRLLQVDHGGILGFGAQSSFIPVDAVTRITHDTVYINQTGRRIAGAPNYSPEIDVDNHQYGPLSGYYGYVPFWNPGYLYPDYPFFGPETESGHRSGEPSW